MKKESIFKKTIKQSLVMTTILGFLSTTILLLYSCMDTPIERTFVLIVGIFMIIPLLPMLISFLVNIIIGSNKPKEMNNKNNSIMINTKSSNSKLQPTIDSNKPKLKVVTTEGYAEFNNILKSSMKNKLLNRETILQLKCELIYRLGTHIEVYKNFEFKNELHCIYTLSKSSVLTKEDYKYLTQFISDNLILPKEA